MRFVLAVLNAFAMLVTVSLADEPLVFHNVAESSGIMPGLQDINGHGAGWGDLDGDGYPELYVGTFDRVGEKPNVLFKNNRGIFSVLDAPATRVTGRANTILFVDLDNDGDLDLYLSNLGGGKTGYAATDSKLFRNDGGKLTDISAESGACPNQFRGRGAAVLDFDGDGDLDLLLGEGLHYGSAKRSRVLRNLGGLKFADVSDEVGLPAGVPGLGVAAGDVNQDGWPDIVLAARDGGNKLFLNDARGRFREWAGSSETFTWSYTSGDDTSCGVCFGDVNADGRTDIIIGHHYDRPWVEPVPIKLYLNRSSNAEDVKFEEVTAAAGLVPLTMKAPHVEVQDFNNDGQADIVTSIVKFAEGKPHPVIFLGRGVTNGVPRFEVPALSVNDFPTDEDKAAKSSGAFFKKMLAEGKVIYSAPAPTADFDRDGRLDLVIPNWFPESPSLLLKNETRGGQWLEVIVVGQGHVNRMGVGCRVHLYEAGRLGDSAALIAVREISVGYGYASGQEAVAHFGLGSRSKCDLEVELPFGLGRVARKGVTAGQRLSIKTSD